MTLAIIVGMKSEAALLPCAAMVACAGGVTARAEALAKAFVAQGATALVSFGIAGGLDPALAPGDLVIGSGVETPEGVVDCDSAWAGRLLAVLGKARSGLVHGSPIAAATVEHKRGLFQRHGALVVDMESGGVARAAKAAGLPLCVIRAVADPADRALPVAALAGLDEQGNARPWPVIKGLLRRPGDLPGLIRVGLDSQRALSALRDLVQIVGPTLGM